MQKRDGWADRWERREQGLSRLFRVVTIHVCACGGCASMCGRACVCVCLCVHVHVLVCVYVVDGGSYMPANTGSSKDNMVLDPWN